MTYSKPEVVVLGEADRIILGSRVSGAEIVPPQDFKQGPADCEFDD
jgi:hypothetical protein